MYVEFNKVVIDKFTTFVGKPQTFRLTSEAPGLRFIRGRNEDEPELESNGAAKSSIFDALTWCLYGRLVDGRRTPDIIPWDEWGGGAPSVSVILFADNRRRNVTRSTSPNKLLLDGLETSQDEIEKIVPPFEVFKHTVLFGQSQPLFFDLSPKEKMDVLSIALNLDRWETRSDLARDRVKEIEQELVGYRSERASIDAKFNQASTLFKQAQDRSKEWEETRKSRKKDIEGEMSKITTQLKPLQKKQDTAKLAVDSAGTELDAITREISKLINERAEAQRAHSLAELTLKSLQDEADALTEELETIGVGDACPTCGQTLKGTALASHRNELRERINRLQGTIKAGIPKRVAQALKSVVSALAAANSHAVQFNKKAQDAQTTLNLTVPQVAKLDAQLTWLETELNREEINPHREQISTLRKSLSALETKTDLVSKDIADAEAEQVRTGFWIKGFKDVRLHTLEELLQELEMATNALLPQSGLINWEVRYSIEKETKKGTFTPGLNVTILSPHNTKPVRWESWSGGEGHRLKVVGALALSEVLLSHAGMQTNLEVLDEPTQHISTRGISDLIEFLAVRAKTMDKDIFFIDQNAVESNRFAEIITVVKTKAGSMIEQ